MSSAELGLFRPVPLADGKLMVLRYTGEGFVPSLIEPKPTEDLGTITFLGEQAASRHPALHAWQPKTLSAKAAETRITAWGEYKPWQEMEMDHLIPGAGAYKHAKSVGVKWNAADFYDLFGPTLRSREGYSAHVGYTRPLVYELPRSVVFFANAAYYGGLNALPGFEIGALQGKTLVKTTVEWSLPPLRFERLGTEGAYASWIRPEVFASYAMTDLQDSARRDNAASLGAQFDLQLQVMHRLPMMLSFGFARRWHLYRWRVMFLAENARVHRGC